MCLAKSAKDARVICFFFFVASVGPTERGGSLRRPSDVVAVVLGSPGLEEEAAAVKGGCALASEAVVLVTASVGEGVRVARASAAAMPKGGAGAGAVSSTALSADSVLKLAVAAAMLGVAVTAVVVVVALSVLAAVVGGADSCFGFKGTCNCVEA